MKITCQNCQEVLEGYLCNIPYQWRKQIAKAICFNLTDQTIDCQDIKECETITSLSAFSVVENEICITYTDEKGVSFTRCFDWEAIQNSKLDVVDPKCITSQEMWDAMSYTERIQAIIDYACTCQEITTTSTTTTTTAVPTTTTTSTTTTTTAEPTTTSTTTTTTL